MFEPARSGSPSSGEKVSARLASRASDSPDTEEDIDAARARILAEQELQKTDPPVLPIMTLLRRKKDQKNLEEIATQPSVYDDPELARYFQPTAKYENLHRFDPAARWTWAEELVSRAQLVAWQDTD